MYEDRKLDEEILNAHKLIDEADVIMFLGFGYDEQNLSILRISDLTQGKYIYGTAFGKSNNEIDRIRDLLNFDKANMGSMIANLDSLKLIRENL